MSSSKKIQSALISVFYKDGLGEIVRELHLNNVIIYSTGGTQQFLEEQKIPCISVESLTGFPSILGGRVKTLHPVIFGGLLGKRNDETHREQMEQFKVPEIDLVIVDLYPFEETVQSTDNEDLIIEKIDIGGPSMIRAAAKNFADVLVVGSKDQYSSLLHILKDQHCSSTLHQRKEFAIKAFHVCSSYDNSISNYFSGLHFQSIYSGQEKPLRYGENPHQKALFFGDLHSCFDQLHGKELSYNNLVDADAALQLMEDFKEENDFVFAIIKHTNVCGIAQRNNLKQSWTDALAGDPESAFGGVLICNKFIDAATASMINELFIEVLIAPGFEKDALAILQSKKNRILLIHNKSFANPQSQKRILNGILIQDYDNISFEKWEEAGGRICSDTEKQDLVFANIIGKHLKSNAIALVKNKQLIGKGCGQTSRIDALRQAIAKANQSGHSTKNAVLASDAFFPFDDCVKIAFENGIHAFIQPGGSVRDKDSIDFCIENKLAMVLTGTRHFKH